MSDTALAESGTRLQNFLDRAGLRGFPWKTSSLLYLISNFWFFLILDSIWWDDNAMFSDNWNDVIRKNGFPPWTHLTKFLLVTFGPSVVRMLTFVIFLVLPCIIFMILSSFEKFDSKLEEKKFIALIFSVVPIVTHKVPAVTFTYSFSLLLFFGAWLVSVRSTKSWNKICSVFLFILSFQNAALIPLFVLPLAHFLYKNEILNQRKSFGRLIWSALGAFLTIPILYLGLRSLFWPNLVGTYQLKANKVDDAIFLVLAAAMAIFAWINSSLLRKQLNLFWISTGLFSCALGLTAFVATNQIGQRLLVKYPVMMFGRSGWFGRHLILQPLGIALIIVGVVGQIFIFSAQSRRLVLGLIIAICVLMNVGFGFEYVVDYQKQVAIVEEVRTSGPNASDSWTFIDRTTLLNARGREYAIHDWVGIISRAKPKSLNIEATDFDLLSSRGIIRSSCLSDVQFSKMSAFVDIQGPETHWEALKNWLSDGDMGFKVTVDDTPEACKSEMVTSEKVSGAIPILFYFTGAKG